jgi:hypothetical protein
MFTSLFLYYFLVCACLGLSGLVEARDVPAWVSPLLIFSWVYIGNDSGYTRVLCGQGLVLLRIPGWEFVEAWVADPNSSRDEM